MISSQFLRNTFSLFIFAFLIASLWACSKKDVVQDEALIHPGGDNAAAAASSVDSVPTTGGDSGAGEAGLSATELKVIHFPYDSYVLTNEARSDLKANTTWLKSNKSSSIQIEGHCDERGTTEYNLALGEKRAVAVKNYLTKAGISKNRLSVISYGKERPIDQGHDESAWAKNRRAAFVILPK